MNDDALMADWTGPVDETWVKERDRRIAAETRQGAPSLMVVPDPVVQVVPVVPGSSGGWIPG